MKHFTHFKAWLMLCLFLIVGGGNSWADTKTGSWNLTSASSDWAASLNETYFSQPYGYKKANGTLTNKSISDFETAGISQIKVGFKCLQNGGTTSKLTIYLVDKNGNTLGSGVVVTPDNKSAASQTTYKYATFTTNLTGATGFMMKVTTFGKNILVNGAEYEVTYTSGTAVDKPTNLSAGTPTSTGTTLSWGAVEHATAYKVEYKVSSADAWTTVSPNPTTNSCELTGLTPSTTYAWQVTALSTEDGYKDGSAQAGANFTTAAPPSHKAYFYVNGALQNAGGTSFTEGASITFPTDPTDIEGKKFQGWTQTQNYSNATTAPSDMTKSANMGDADVTYYAVFATASAEGEPTAYTAGDTGNYVIAFTGGTKWFALPNNPTVNSGKITGEAITVSTSASSVNYVTSSNASGYVWTIANATNGQTISDGTNFIYHSNGGASGTNLAYGNSTSYTWKIESETNGLTFKGMSGSTVNSRGMLAYNTTIGGYALSNEDNKDYYRIQVLPVGGGTTYSDYTTNLATQYDVKFYVDGEEQTGLAQKVVEGGNPTTVTEPTKTGYTFDGWYEASDFSGDKIADVTSVTISADKNFYGRFNAINYTITYNNVEGATHSNPATYTIETATINLADASKDGFIFQGWFDNESMTGDAATTIAQGSTGDKSFWAKWTAVPANPSVVTFNVGEHGTCETASATEETVGAGVVLPAVTANEGWVFKGWSTENPATAETLVSAGDDGKYHIVANTTLYAYYKVKPATPTFSSEVGAIEKGTEVTISCTTDDAVIYYTTNGEEPTAESAAYSEAITVSAAQTIKAIAILDGEQSEVATAEYTVAQHTAQFSINGIITDANNSTVAKGEAITFPADPAAPEGHVFIGWKKGGEEITTPQNEAIATVDKTTEVMGTEDVTYYAVWAVGSGSGDASTPMLTLDFTDSGWNFPAGSSNKTVDETSYTNGGQTISVAGSIGNGFYLMQSTAATPTPWALLFGKSGAYLKLPAPSSAVSKMKFYPATGGSPSTSVVWNVYAGDNVASILDIPEGGTNNDITGLKDDAIEIPISSSYANSALTVKVNSAHNIQISKVEYYGSGISYSDYSTKVSLDPKPTIVLSATELAEYAGNTNTSITASVSEGEYTGALTVESSADAVATATISEGTITINALTAGSATITVTAPEVTGFRKNTATIAVTVSEKLAHGLSFSTDALNLTVGDTEYSEPTLNNPNNLTVVYSLVYAKDENKDKVATIDPATGKITLADPSLSTETQGAVTVKAHTDGDNSHAAGDVTYDLVVARKVSTTSWSNEGVAVTIDKDEIATLPTASNTASRNIAYESSNEEVSKFVEGVLTFVAYGTTTITAKTSATAEYAATSASYELTFAPRYTVTFKVYGKDDVVLREETTGAGVTAPSVDDINGKVFRGWAEDEIDGTTNDAPTFVTTATLDEDKTLYAVFATEDTGSGPSGSITLSNKTISGLKTTQWAYDNTGKTLTEDDYTWTFDGTYHGSGLSYLQLGQKSGLIHTPTCPGNITSIVINCKGASGRNLQVYSGDTKVGDAESTPTSDNDVTLTISGSYTQLNIANHDGNGGYSSSNNAININSITVNYGSAPTYSNYCTKVGPTVTTSNGVRTVNGVVSGTDVATVTTGVTAGTSLDMTGAIVTDEVLEDISEAVADLNILIYAPESSNSKAVNVVVVDGESRTCENLVLTDKVAVNIPEEILAGNITYERKTDGDVDVLKAGKYATVYLPYAFPVGDFQVMEFSGINDNGVVSFTYVEETKANVPYIIRPKNVDEAPLSFNITGGENTVTTTIAEPAEGMSVNDKDTDKMLARRKAAQGDEGKTGFYGTYEELMLNGDNGYYGFASGVFKKANTESGTLIRPFRAYLFVDKNSATRLATFSFEEKDNLVTRVNNVIEALENNEPMYDLNGHAIAEPVRGQINIIRGQKVIFK